MKMTPDYAYLLQQIEYNVGASDSHRELLDDLKKLFINDINSPRRFEQLKSIGDLLKILELRDVVSDDNVGALKLISTKLNNAELIKQIDRYECSHISKGLFNYYAKSQSPGSYAQNYNSNQQTIQFNNPYCKISVLKRDRIMKTIINEIGTSWRDLGRHLKIQEGEIEDIDIFNSTIHNKVTKLLEVYEKHKWDPERWFFTLCEALNKSRRKDLSKSIQDIMMMNI